MFVARAGWKIRGHYVCAGPSAIADRIPRPNPGSGFGTQGNIK